MSHSDRVPTCIVTPEFPGPMLSGGLGTAVYWQAGALRAAGIPVTVFCTGDVTIKSATEWEDRFRNELGIEYIAAGPWMEKNAPELVGRRIFPNHFNLVRALWVQEFLSRCSFPVVYLQDYGGQGLRVLQMKTAGLAFEETEFVLTLHGPTRWALDGLELFPASPEQLVIQYQERECAMLADRIVAPSAHMRRWVVEHWGIAARRISVHPYCFESGRTGEPVERHGPFSHLIFFGRLETRKGLEMFVDAIVSSQAVGNVVKRVTFLGKSGQAAGTGGRLWIEEALGGDVPFSWEILDDRDTFQAWSWLHQQEEALIVAPSLSDNLPYSVIELFQRRFAFLTTSAGGIPEIVGDNPEILAEPTLVNFRQRLDEILSSGSLTIRHDTGFDAEKARSSAVALHNRSERRSGHGKRETEPAVLTTNEELPEVSVIVPHFNSAGYLRFALESLARQWCTFLYEVIVIDDASTREVDREGFAQLSRDYQGDRRFRFFSEANNRGAGGARNFGVSKALGRYVAFFDADNEALPDFLGVYHRAIEFSGYDVLTCFLESVNQDDYDHPSRLVEKRVDLLFTPPGPALEAGCFINVFGDTASICRREAFDRIGGFSADSPRYQRIPSGDWDWDFFSKAALAGLRVGVVPKVLFRYRNSPGNQQNSNRRRYFQNRSVILSRYSSPEARKRVDWFQMLAMFENYRPGGSVPTIGLYDYFAGVSDELLMAAIGRSPRKPNDQTIYWMRKRLSPLLRNWEETRPRIFLYGAGLHTRVLLGTLPELATYVTGLIDRVADGRQFLGFPVFRPDEFDPTACDIVLYSSKENEKAMYESFRNQPVQHILIYE